MNKSTLPGIALLAALSLTSCVEITGTPAEAAQDIVDRATATVERFATGKDDLGFSKYVAEAKGMVILPRAIKASFLFGAEAGNGVLVVRGADGAWGPPAFYALAGASFGFQIGIQDVETVLVVRNEKAIDAILKHQAKFGADAGITVGMLGGGVEAATTANLDADVLAFTHAIVGAYGGISFEGSALVRRKDLNEAYYGKGATPQGIIRGGKHTNSKAAPLSAALAKF
jgi:lipid-binding SYLF domain-containing protein